jgi:uncharacterized protein with von Willebrand factor type A (vWA) domain
MSGKFVDFENFGLILDASTRKRFAEDINLRLQNNTEGHIDFVNTATENFASAVDEVLSYSSLKELCSNSSDLAEEITREVLDFINTTKKQIVKSENPYEAEYQLLQEGIQTPKKEFIPYFKKASAVLKNNYSNEDLDFYAEQFKSCYFEDEWITDTGKKVDEMDIELSFINKFEKIIPREKEFFHLWRDSLNVITKRYSKRDINCNDYFSRFRVALSKEKEKRTESFSTVKEEFISNWKQLREKRITREEKEKKVDVEKNKFIKSSIEKSQNDKFVAVKEHFIENMEKRLKEKQLKWELDFIEEQRMKFCEDLYRRIEELKKLRKVLEPFGNELGRLWDMTRGNWQKVNFDVLKRYADLLQNDQSLLELAEMLGRMQQAEKEYEEELFTKIQFKSEWKIEHASKSDLIGIHESDDLSSLLPSETALLADETIQTVFFKKFAEKRLQTFEYQSSLLSMSEEEVQDKRLKQKESVKGPFIVCIDTSGSMHGTPETVAKTLCFALLKIAVRENRKCYLISFSTGIETLNLTDMKNSLDKLIAFLSMSFNGGTDATPAMQEALRMLQTNDYKKADVIMVSDFVMPAFENTLQTQIEKAKNNNTRFHSLIIGNSQNSATIKDFDNNWYYDLSKKDGILTLIKNLKKI